MTQYLADVRRRDISVVEHPMRVCESMNRII